MSANSRRPLIGVPVRFTPASCSVILLVLTGQEKCQARRQGGVLCGTLQWLGWLQNQPLAWFHFRALPARTRCFRRRTSSCTRRTQFRLRKINFPILRSHVRSRVRSTGCTGQLSLSPPASWARFPAFPALTAAPCIQVMGIPFPFSTTPEEIERKVMAMVTDPARIHPTDPGHPKVCPAFAYHRVFNPQGTGEVEQRCRRGEIGCVACKRGLAQSLVEKLLPFRQVREQWKGRTPELWDILREGTKRARPIAQAAVAEVHSKMGLPNIARMDKPR